MLRGSAPGGLSKWSAATAKAEPEIMVIEWLNAELNGLDGAFIVS